MGANQEGESESISIRHFEYGSVRQAEIIPTWRVLALLTVKTSPVSSSIMVLEVQPSASCVMCDDLMDD